MKPDSNMETDRLLQRYARRGQDPSILDAISGDGSQEKEVLNNNGATSHLDADELVAFAENALPAATRLRYAGHLADCDTCRKLVTELAISAGVAVSTEDRALPVTQTRERSWRDWIAVIFAPRVMRYAASVVVLIGITAIALVVFRDGASRKFTTSESSRQDDSGKENPGRTATKNNTTVENGAANIRTPAAPDDRTLTTNKAQEVPKSSVPTVSREGAPDSPTSGLDQPSPEPSAPAVSAIGGMSKDKSAIRDEDVQLAERRPSPAKKAVDKVDSAKESDNSVSDGRLKQEPADRAQGSATSNSQGARVARKVAAPGTLSSEEKGRARSNSESAPSSPAKVGDDAKSRADGADAYESTRTVGGKQFVRRGGAWVDVAYGSQSTINVRRGSDQYRALVADEPGLRAIANQLSGAVVVVWKGRAYKIK